MTTMDFETNEKAWEKTIKNFKERMELSGGKLTLDGNGKITSCKWSNVQEVQNGQVSDSSRREDS